MPLGCAGAGGQRRRAGATKAEVRRPAEAGPDQAGAGACGGAKTARSRRAGHSVSGTCPAESCGTAPAACGCRRWDDGSAGPRVRFCCAQPVGHGWSRLRRRRSRPRPAGRLGQAVPGRWGRARRRASDDACQRPAPGRRQRSGADRPAADVGRTGAWRSPGRRRHRGTPMADYSSRCRRRVLHRSRHLLPAPGTLAG